MKLFISIPQASRNQKSLQPTWNTLETTVIHPVNSARLILAKHQQTTIDAFAVSSTLRQRISWRNRSGGCPCVLCMSTREPAPYGEGAGESRSRFAVRTKDELWPVLRWFCEFPPWRLAGYRNVLFWRKLPARLDVLAKPIKGCPNSL